MGYLLDVDLIYPEAIHDETQHFPLAPEDFEISDNLLSREMRMQLEMLNRSRGREPNTPMKTCRKLVANCCNKTHYVVHFKALQFYLQMGMRIAVIHQIVQFKQEAIYRDYIDFNTSERAKATNEFTKTYYKQINCSLFGKSMEDVRNRLKVCLFSTAAEYQHEVSKPLFNGATVLAENLVLTKRSNANVSLKSTIAIGAAVLDLSKVIMYDLVYKKLPSYAEKFNCKITPVGGDTDSLFVTVEGVDYQTLLSEMMENGLLDTSNYNQNHARFSLERCAQLGCVKDEFKGAFCKEIVMLTPKCYSMDIVGQEKNKCTAKGVGREVIKSLTHDAYKDRITLQSELVCKVKRMQSFKHEIFHIEQSKVALTFFDNKRFWVDGNNSLPYGHYRCRDYM